ncbi:MAG: LytTR family transcriptional regulator DNA-binding domain-containing protein [Candidatus Zixiibacteriota bacterium]|nr:MAG: LytTR family transcriptional regulator DNA-binding domain-containing protein [candidate division Zixibacteria bacterium]
MLKQPSQPIAGARYGLVVSLSFSLFVLAFLYVFEPFGLNLVEPGRRINLIIGYAVTCFVILQANILIMPRIFPGFFKDENWILAKKILWQLWLVFTVGAGCFLVNSWMHLQHGENRFNVGRFMYFQLTTMLVGVFPIVILNLLANNRSLRLHSKLSREMSSQLESRDTVAVSESERGDVAVLLSENEKERYEVDPDDIIYALSEGNYTKIFVAGEQEERLFIRSSLKRIAHQLVEYPFLFRCHRAYIVNLRKVTDITGNAQGLRLTLEDSATSIPVARGYVGRFRRQLQAG